MRLGVFNSAWGNVGNAFFAYGLISFLRRNFPQHEVLELDEPHPYLVPQNRHRLLQNVFNLSAIQDVDVYVFSGPILAQIVRFGFASVIRAIKSAGKEYMILSSSASEMNADEIKAVADVLNEFRPLAFATRDEETYLKFKDLTPFCFNGICGAFLIPFIDGVADVKARRPYFISSFYKKPEPVFSVKDGDTVSVDSVCVAERKPLFGMLPLRYSRHFEWLRKSYLDSLNGVDIVRVHQGFNPAMCYFNYAQPNSFVSYNPRSYLSVYKGCEFVISDRVHACAAALAYGHPARLLDVNDRIGIFSRMGISRDRNGIMRPLEHDAYHKMVESYLKYLKSVVPEK